MTKSPEPVEAGALKVTQADRDIAAEYMRRFPDLRLPEAFARHRQSHSLPGDVGMREALTNAKYALEYWERESKAWSDSRAPGARPGWMAETRRRGREEIARIARFLAALTPSALSDIQRLGQDYDDGSLGRFGHHPEPAIDFECEVEQIESIVSDLEKGMRQGEPVPLERIERAMAFRVGGDQSAVAAKSTLRELEKRAAAVPSALSGDAGEGAKLREHFARMMEAAANYVEPTTYIARHPDYGMLGPCKFNTEFPEPTEHHADSAKADIKARRDQAFIRDMIYMLDGPEQRAAIAGNK